VRVSGYDLPTISPCPTDVLARLEAEVGEGAAVDVAPVEVVLDARLLRGVLAQRRLGACRGRG
jgi:hypothetical protein